MGLLPAEREAVYLLGKADRLFRESAHEHRGPDIRAIITNLLNEYVEGGTFRFSDYERSVLWDAFARGAGSTIISNTTEAVDDSNESPQLREVKGSDLQQEMRRPYIDKDSGTMKFRTIAWMDGRGSKLLCATMTDGTTEYYLNTVSYAVASD